MNNRLTSILLAIALIGSLFLYFNTPSGHDQEIKRLENQIKAHKHKADSLNQYAKGLKDSLNIAFNTIKIQDANVKQDSIKAFKARKRYESIIFKPIANDHQRDSLLSELYPSFRPVR